MPAHFFEFTRTETFMIVSFVLVVGISLGAGLILQKIIFTYLRKITQKTKTQLDDIIIYSIRSPFVLWCLILGISLGLKTTKLPKPTLVTIDKVLLSLWVLSAIIVTLRIITQFVKIYGKKFETTIPLTSVTQNAAKLAVAVIGILVLLKTLGIAITPILTTLGIGGLAVALALQDTLSNLFSGIYIAAGKQIRIGDYIELESGQSGYVIDIGWRATRIRQLPNNIIIIPNAKLSQTIITNYFLPEKEIKVYVQVGVHYDSDLEQMWAYDNVKIFSPIKKCAGKTGRGAYKIPPENFNVYKLLSKKIEKETADNLVSPVLTQEDYEKRKQIVNLLELPENIENTIRGRLSNLENKDGNIDLLPFKTIRQKFTTIYNSDKVVTYEDSVKKRRKRRKKK